jgi:hypothetical protein
MKFALLHSTGNSTPLQSVTSLISAMGRCSKRCSRVRKHTKLPGLFIRYMATDGRNQQLALLWRIFWFECGFGFPRLGFV